MTEKTKIKISIEGVDVTRELEKNLLSLTYVDNDTDQADDLQIEISDEEGKWLQSYLMQNQEKQAKELEITALIIQENYRGAGKSKLLDCGVFCVDDVGVSGPPTKIKFKALSIPYNANIKEQKKTKAWEEINLETIGKEIAANSGLKYIYDSKVQAKYKRREQKEESDLKFLLRLCKDAGISIKVTSKTLVLYDAVSYEAKKAIGTIEYGSSDILSYSFNTNKNETAYTGAEVKSKDPKTGKYIKFAYNIPNAKGEKKILEIKEKVNSKEEAEALAQKRLRSANKGEFNASITLVGNVDYIASQTIEIKGFGLYDGKYIINSASHKLTGGYTVALKLNKVLEGY